jgi:NADH-quinone oxidoreductase subunit G
VLNSRIRKRWRRGGLAVGLVGQRAALTYAYEHLGAGAQSLAEIAEGRSMFAGVLRQAKRPMIIIGAGAYTRADGTALLALAARIALASREGSDLGWNPFSVLHTAAARVAGLDLAFVPQPGGLDAQGMLSAAERGALDTLFLLGADEIDTSRLGEAFVIYQGTHGDAGAHRADVILPGAAYTEKSATYVNTEGRAQTTARAAYAPGVAKEDWAILRALSAKVGHTLPYDNLPALRAAMYKEAPQLARLDEAVPADRSGVESLARVDAAAPADEPFEVAIHDFYLTNPVARASTVMAEMSALKKASEAAPALHAAE